MLHALENASPGSASSALAVWETGANPLEAVLASVINELTVRPEELILVLDDYHVDRKPHITEPMRKALRRLVEGFGPNDLACTG